VRGHLHPVAQGRRGSASGDDGCGGRGCTSRAGAGAAGVGAAGAVAESGSGGGTNEGAL